MLDKSYMEMAVEKELLLNEDWFLSSEFDEEIFKIIVNKIEKEVENKILNDEETFNDFINYLRNTYKY